MNLKEKLKGIRSNISSAQEKVGIDHPVEIVGVTKTYPFSFIEASYEAGIRSIGENRVQEASTKFESFEQMPELKKRFIGHLQSNKAKKCVELFDSIDSVGSIKTLRKIGKYAQQLKKDISIFFQFSYQLSSSYHGMISPL